MTPIAIENVVAEYERLGCPAAILGLVENADASGAFLRGTLVGATPERQREIAAAIAKRSEEAMEDAYREERRHTRAVLEGTEQPTPEEEATANQERIEAEAERQDFVARRPERIETLIARAVELLERVADGLARR